MDRFAECLPVLREQNLLPETQLAVAVVGSMARGWDHETSDLDLIVVSTDAFTDDRVFTLPVPLIPDVVPAAAFDYDGRRWEVKFWLDKQIDQMLDKVAWEAFDTDTHVRDRFSLDEMLLLERLTTCVPISGEQWIRRRREQIAGSAFRAFMIVQALTVLDSLVEAALGQLAAGDTESAVLSAYEALGSAIDALLAGHGEFGAQMKWRARRFRAAAPVMLSFDEYWGLQTMRTFDPENPEGWVREVISLCRKITMEVEVR